MEVALQMSFHIGDSRGVGSLETRPSQHRTRPEMSLDESGRAALPDDIRTRRTLGQLCFSLSFDMFVYLCFS